MNHQASTQHARVFNHTCSALVISAALYFALRIGAAGTGRPLMEFIAVRCDECNCQKQETNHWLVEITHPEFAGVLYVPADAQSEALQAPYVRKDICGRACAVKRLNQWLETLTTPSTERRSA